MTEVNDGIVGLGMACRHIINATLTIGTKNDKNGLVKVDCLSLAQRIKELL